MQVQVDPNEFKNHQLPLARIKKIMKSDEDVRMIAAEAPVLFAKACEMFILELTLRSWIHSEENKRRLSGKKAKKGKKGKGKGNGKKPHIKTIDGVNPGGWLDGAQGSSEWDEDLQAIDDVTGDYVHDPFIDDVTGDYVAQPDDSD